MQFALNLAHIEREHRAHVATVPKVIAVGSKEVLQPMEKAYLACLYKTGIVLGLEKGGKVFLGGLQPLHAVAQRGLGPLIREIDTADGAGIVRQGMAEVYLKEDQA